MSCVHLVCGTIDEGRTTNDQQKSDGQIVHSKEKSVEVERELLSRLPCKVISKRKHSLYTETGGTMETKSAGISQLSSENADMVFTSMEHLINKELLRVCYKDMDGKKMVGIDGITKETLIIENNSQLKDDRKDLKLIANLVKEGNYGMPYLPEKIYADMRELSMKISPIPADIVALGMEGLRRIWYEARCRSILWASEM